MTRSLLWFQEIDAGLAALVGGKGLNLGLMTVAGLPVPTGFVLTPHHADESEFLSAYQQLGGGLVAVRSSATDEDGAELSFAGQQETILGVQGADALLDAIRRCRQSLATERAVAYRSAQGVREEAASMAVVIQQLVPAEVSGVLFTRDPLDPTGEKLLIEAAWGLGEAVVSGRVTPDRYHVDRSSRRLINQHIACKRERLSADGWTGIPEHQQQQACLSPDQLAKLATIAGRIEQFYGEPRDVEWAFANGQFFVLQARPITTLTAAELEQARREEVERIRKLANGKEVIWARYNLAEVLPTPTPLTWSIVREFMSGSGGFGAMFRSLGYDPDPELDKAGFIDLICGRPYVNLDREPKLFFRDFPYGYDFAAIRARSEAGMYPQLTTIPSRKTKRFWWRLPAIAWRMISSTGRIKSAMQTEAARLNEEIYPQFARLALDHRKEDLSTLSDDVLHQQFREWKSHINKFAEHSLRPGVLAATALAELEQLLASTGVKDADGVARQLVLGVAPLPDCDLPGALRRLSQGELSRDDFLVHFGHRGPQEMELAEPRWSEIPNSIVPGIGQAHTSMTRHAPAQLADVVDLQKHSAVKSRLESALHHARTYLALRESSKHYLMLGFERLRAILRELGRRLGIGDDIFYLDVVPSNDSFIKELLGQIKAAKGHRKRMLAIAAPPVIFSDDLDAIGRPVSPVGAAEWSATALSFGSFEGPALVLEQPVSAESVAPGFVLVCPSTDPAWVPLFLKAGALVMESGGVLSHGAIVAREFGIPAVAGIANVHRQLRTGQRLQVDGTTGKVHVFELAE